MPGRFGKSKKILPLTSLIDSIFYIFLQIICRLFASIERRDHFYEKAETKMLRGGDGGMYAAADGACGGGAGGRNLQ